MSVTTRFLIFQLVVIVPFLAGAAAGKHMSNREQSSRRLIRTNLIFIEPVIAFWSIWGLPFRWDMMLLPVSGVFLVLLGMAAGRLSLVVLPLTDRSRATFLISSSIANHGFTMGAFLCYLFMGEEGLGLASLFVSYFLVYVFTVIFPYARSVSSGSKGPANIIRQYVFDLQNMPVLAILLAISLHALHITRPSVPFPIDLLMLASISLYYFSLGVNFTISDLFSSLKENLMLALIKFMAVPAVCIAVLSAIELDVQMKAVIILQSFMPAAIYSVVSSVLFGLDTKLATNLFVVNTLIFLFLVLPLLFLCKGYILGI